MLCVIVWRVVSGVRLPSLRCCARCWLWLLVVTLLLLQVLVACCNVVVTGGVGLAAGGRPLAIKNLPKTCRRLVEGLLVSSA